MKKWFLVILTLILLYAISSCGTRGKANTNILKSNGNTQNTTEDSIDDIAVVTTDFGEYEMKPYDGIISGVKLYDGGYFSLKIPNGWEVKTVGQYFDSGILVFDPMVPERQIFYYCHIVEFLKSQQAKEELAGYAAFDQSYALRADMPVLATGDAEEFFLGYPVLLAACDKWNNAAANSSHYPDMRNIEVLEKKESTLPAGPTCMENSVTRISYSTLGGILCEGLTAQQTDATIDAISPGTGNNLGYNSVNNFMGFTARDGELAEMESVLAECLCSFAFTEDYVEESVRAAGEQTDNMLAQAAQMNAAYDAYNAAWSARQTSYDIMSQQRSDTTLGYDRLYDPTTGEVYRAEVGFYDSYNINRDQYSNSNLQRIDESSESYYLNVVDYYIEK